MLGVRFLKRHRIEALGGKNTSIVTWIFQLDPPEGAHGPIWTF